MKNKLLTAKQLDKPDQIGKSARYTPLGTVSEHPWIPNLKMVLVDKIVYPSFKCPFCHGSDTYNKRMQRGGLCAQGVSNVWRVSRELQGLTHFTKKYDFCFTCAREFLLEGFVWQIKTKDKKGFLERIKDKLDDRPNYFG